ncbi:MAG: hypothetical protein RSB82_00435 [Victivallaceae bacterium]
MVFVEYLRKKLSIPTAFAIRRLHSLTGLAFTLFVCEHLFTNSLSSSLLAEGKYFVWMVDGFHKIPGLKVIEICLLALPFGLHAVVGIKYALEAKFNSVKHGNDHPHCNFERNHAYSWQRITAWFLLVGILLHVVHMRFMEYPRKITLDDRNYYLVTLNESVSSKKIIDTLSLGVVSPSKDVISSGNFSLNQIEKLASDLQVKDFLDGLKDQWVVVASSAGQAFLVIVRKSFTSVFMSLLYSMLVLTAVYHGFNGLWSFTVRWGIIISQKKQMLFLKYAFVLMLGVAFLGLFAVWGTYWSSK